MQLVSQQALPRALRGSALPVSLRVLQRAEYCAGRVWTARSGRGLRFWLPVSLQERPLRRSFSREPRLSLRRDPSRQTDRRPTVRLSPRWSVLSGQRPSALWLAACGPEPVRVLRSPPRLPRLRRVLRVWTSETCGHGPASHTPLRPRRLPPHNRLHPHNGRSGACCASAFCGRHGTASHIPRRPRRLQTPSRPRRPVWSCRRLLPEQR